MKIKKAVFFTPFALWPYHFETELELIEQYLKTGYEVTLLACTGKLPTCEPNPLHERWTCRMCKSRFNDGLKWVGRERVIVEDFYRITNAQKKYIKQLEKLHIASQEELKNIYLEGSDIGLAAFSSTVSYLRDPQPDIVENIEIIRKHLLTAAIVHFSIKNHISEKLPDLFFLCNGRYSTFRPALRVAQTLGVETYVHERAGSLGNYSLCKNTYPHDLNLVKSEIENIYDQSYLPDAEKRSIAYSWYEERINKKTQGWVSFTKQQDRDFLPPKILSTSPQTVKVGIFNSSEDEFVAFHEWENPFYKDQNDGIVQIIECFKDDPSIRFFLRIHPNLSNIDNSQTQHLEKLKNCYSNLEIIDAKSKVDTYALMRECDIILTFGSTVGVEALYHKKPSILMSRAFYEDLKGIIRPRSHLELVQILKDFIQMRQLPEVESSEISIAKYGFFQKEYGHKFKFVKPYEISKVSLNKDGTEYFLEPSFWAKALNKLRV